MSTSNKLFQAASGNAGESVYVEDVFSTVLYSGGSAHNFEVGVDMTEGGLLWFKRRDSSQHHALFDSESDSDFNKYLRSEGTNALDNLNDAAHITVDSEGFNLSSTGYNLSNNSSGDYVTWMFRKQAGFFDVVTYTGNGSNRTISHNLGSVPGVMIVKRTSDTEGWQVYHRDLATDEYLELNVDSAKSNSNGTLRWNSTRPTATELSLGTHDSVNASGSTYVAYLFAHDDQSFGDDSDESIIKCGSYTGNGSSDGPTVTLGFEPQWLMIKRVDGGTGDWTILDNMRGIYTGSLEDARLFANRDYVESNNALVVDLQATGFKITSAGSVFNNSGNDYAYIAIRRPMKTPEAGTEVFKAVARSGNSTAGTSITCGFPLDWVVTQGRSAISYTRLQGSSRKLFTYSTSTEGSSGTNVITSFDQDGMTVGTDTDINTGSWQLAIRTYF